MIAGALAATLPLPLRAETRVAAAAREALGGARTAREKVAAAIQWTHASFDWTSTDYKKRSAEEIISRRHGNCYEQALVVSALLNEGGVRTRIARELNVQPASADRQRAAEEKIAEAGTSMSVFGERHNDHAWTEYFDEANLEWVPSDPTLNIYGYQSWIPARVGFGPRPVHKIIPYADMLFPIAIIVPLGNGRYEGRTDRYLVKALAQEVPGVAEAREWPRWVELVRSAEQRFIEALSGTYNLHSDRSLFEALSQTYAALKSYAGLKA